MISHIRDNNINLDFLQEQSDRGDGSVDLVELCWVVEIVGGYVGSEAAHCTALSQCQCNTHSFVTQQLSI